ncbi:hypothetical protein GCM10023331_00320 [Algivirga pacifica]|uniref:N-end rule aminoacyl transferase C-terminal domain-containing protein n=2 Tax=Algivirga pacifica TaxID=1162670 RepID=A0ABP9CYU4_9BACT
MIFEFDMPEVCNGKALDDYLENGWFRDGSLMSRYEMIHFREQIYSVVPLRAQLNGFSFSRSQRKLLRRNSFLTQVIQPITFTEEKEEMYQTHRMRFKSKNSPKTLKSYFIEESSNMTPFETWELSLYDGDTLAGVSFFDVGEKSICSILAIFNPAYEPQSIGITTMLREVEYALSLNKEYYYPGYVLDQPSVFDYKKRLSNLEFFNWEGNWESMNYFDPTKAANHIIRSKLTAVLQLLDRSVLRQLHLVHNEQFFYHVWHQTFDLADVIPAPMYLECITPWAHKLNIQYDLKQKEYILSLHHYYAIFAQSSDPEEIAGKLMDIYHEMNTSASYQQNQLSNLKQQIEYRLSEDNRTHLYSNGNKTDGFIELAVEGEYLTLYISFLTSEDTYEVTASNGVREIQAGVYYSLQEVLDALKIWVNKKSLGKV